MENEQIKALHKSAYVIDSHCDTPMVFDDGIDLSKRNERGHVDLERIQEGGVDALFWAVYTPAHLLGTAAINHSMGKISRIYDFVDSNRDRIALARNVEEALQNKEKGLISLFLGLENASPIHEDLAILHFYKNFGISYITLCHSENNEVCDSSTSSIQRWKGLSPFGIRLVREMNRIGIMIDVSHISDESFYDVLHYSEKPVIASHSSCRALCDVPRNMSDDMIRALAEKGGVIQINFYPCFLDPEFSTPEYRELSSALEEATNLYFSDPKHIPNRERYIKLIGEMRRFKSISFKKICDHIDYVSSLVGPAYVGLGSNFDGIDITPSGMEDISKYPAITQELAARGYSEKGIRGILGENLMRVMRASQVC